MASFILTRQAPAGKWGSAALKKTGEPTTIGTIAGIGPRASLSDGFDGPDAPLR